MGGSIRLAGLVLAGLLAALGEAWGQPAAPRSATPAPSQAQAAVSRPPVILISIDGFRADYIRRRLTPTLMGLARDGVWARDGMRSAFPSITFPNHYTLVTGRTPDHHGVVANTMDDPRIQPDSHFTIGDYAAVSDPRWWDEATPIWVTAKRQGLRVATMFWPGSEAPIHGVRPDYWAHYDAAVTADQRVDVVLDWLSLPPEKRPAFVTLYFDQVDTQGHRHGPDSPQVDAALASTDAAVARLTQGLRARGIAADLILVADHGMAAVSPGRRIVLDEVTDLTGATVIDSGAFAGVTPADDAQARALLGRHGPMTCWRKADIPARLGYGTNARIPPIVCLAEVGWLIATRAEAAKPGHPLAGEHGYDPRSPSMAALFVANGPDFRRGLQVAPFDNVDVYPLTARVLGVVPEPNDGRLSEVAPMLGGSAPAASGSAP